MKVCSRLCKSGLLLTHWDWPTGCGALGQAKGKEIKRSILQSRVGASQWVQPPHLFLYLGNLHLMSLDTETSSALKISGIVTWRCCCWILTPKPGEGDTMDRSSFFVVAVAIEAVVSWPETIEKGSISHVSCCLASRLVFKPSYRLLWRTSNPINVVLSLPHSLFLSFSLSPSSLFLRSSLPPPSLSFFPCN